MASLSFGDNFLLLLEIENYSNYFIMASVSATRNSERQGGVPPSAAAVGSLHPWAVTWKDLSHFAVRRMKGSGPSSNDFLMP